MDGSGTPPNPSTPATSLEITSTVRQLKHGACIRWTGVAIGEGLRIDGIHVWNFTKVEGGVRPEARAEAWPR